MLSILKTKFLSAILSFLAIGFLISIFHKTSHSNIF